jgi:ABC-type transporter Mla subunit MlaD
MAGRDEGLDKFEAFIDLLGKTRNDFQQNSQRIDSLEDELNKKEDEAEKQIGAFSKSVDDFTDGFATAHQETIGALETMIAALGDLADDRLGEAIKTVEEVESEVEKAVDAFSSTLQGGFDDLSADGFEAASSSVDTLEALVGELKQGAEDAFGELEDSLEEMRREAETARNTTVDSFNDVADEVKDALTEAVDSGFEAFTGGLNAGAQLLEGGLGNLGELLETSFTSFEGAAEQIGESLMDAGRQILEDAQHHVQDELMNTMQDAFANMVEEVVAGLVQEIAESIVMMTAGSAITTAIGAYVPALVAAKKIVGTINDLLDMLNPF